MAQEAPHVSKAQKRRQAREQEEAEREQRIADELAQMGDSERALEERSLTQLLQPLGLAVQDIPVSRPLQIHTPGCSCLACKAEPMAQRHLTGVGTSASMTADRTMAPQADGHCLYRAVNDQLRVHSNGSGCADNYWAIRLKAASYMRAHPDQFLPFMPEVHSSSLPTPFVLPDQIIQCGRLRVLLTASIPIPSVQPAGCR